MSVIWKIFLIGLWLPLVLIFVLPATVAAVYPYPTKRIIQYNFSYSPPELLSKKSTIEQLVEGKKLFHENCAACHGQKAVGQDPAQPLGYTDVSGNRYAPALNGTGHAFSHHINALFFIAKYGGGWREDTPMKGWNGRLEDEELISIIHYVRSLWPKEMFKNQDNLYDFCIY